MSTDELKALKFIWAYMVTEASNTTGEWSYYGSHWEFTHGYDYQKNKAENAKVREAVKVIGVDWSKMEPPVYRSQRGFADSDSPSETCHSLLGTLHFKDGTSVQLGVSDADEMYREAAEAFARFKEASAKVQDVFGDEEQA